MAKITFKNGDEYLGKLSRLNILLRERVIGRGVYAGAAVVTDAVRSGVEALPTDDRFVRGGNLLRGPGKVQKKALLSSLGITPMRDDGKGFLNVKAGFHGYNSVKTKRWPKGQPNQMIARSVERGTSFMTANPFMKKAVSRARKQAVDAMRKAADREIEKIMK